MLKIAWHESYAHPLPHGHRFPMEKYNLLPQQLLYEGTISSENIFTPEFCDMRHIERVHDLDYLYKLQNLKLTASEIRKTGFPLSKSLVDREIRIAGGTLEATNHALKHKVAMNIAGGTHHAFSSHGEGFCLLNDQAIAAAYLVEQLHLGKILFVDLDVHQGNGTASIFKGNEKYFTFSMHGEKNYPMVKETSNFDVALPEGCNDTDYLMRLTQSLDLILAKFTPEFIFYQAGVDVLASDKLGKLGLTKEGCKQRDEIVFSFAKSINSPIVVCMGGGYSVRIRDIVDTHAQTFRMAQNMYF